MEHKNIILKLKESLENDFGDYGRTNYIIEKLEKRDQLPNSDYLYIDRMMKLCEPISIEDIKSRHEATMISAERPGLGPTLKVKCFL